MPQNTGLLQQLRRAVLWLTLLTLGILLCLSVISSFLGSQKAGFLFNTAPAVFYWLFFVCLLLAGLLIFPSLLRKPGLFLIHLGCVVILLGSMWSSPKGHLLQNRLLGTQKIHKGVMAIYEGSQQNQILEKETGEVLGPLPFSVYLEDFWMEYHWGAGSLHVRKTSDPNTPPPSPAHWQIPDQPGRELLLPPPLKKITILRVLRNLKITDRVTDRLPDEVNPALQVEIEWANGTKKTSYVFPADMPHVLQIEGFSFTYEPGATVGIKDFYSNVMILDYHNYRQQPALIEVNHPLRYGGYHLYQSSYGRDAVDTSRGREARWYTVLDIISDSGLRAVFLGYFLLCAGVFWQCWIRHLIRHFGQRSVHGN